ncbi:MAG: asparagine synthetase B, partial [Piscinibacter sp.]|uniref:asparagine synthetase B family protein n=1 Tax=Piscinibacter sp. TaxID=1903157 RepID=UPI003D14D6A6
MRGLCGWFGGAAAPHEALAGMLAGVGAGDGADRALPHGAALAAYGGNARPRLSQHEGMTLILAGHPRLRAGAQRLAAAEQIADALRARGREALADLGGDFALAAWDSTRQRGWLAIDRIGIHPLVYTRLGDTLLFASSLDALCGHPDVHPALSSQAIYDYLYYHVCPGPDTIYQGMQRLGAGQYIEFGDGAAREPQQFWQIRFAEDDAADFGKLKAQFVSLLEAAVGESTEGAAVGAFLSGGTDSSTVNGMLCRVSGRPAPAYSIGFDVPGFDETEYARIAARHFGCAHGEYYVTPADVVEALPRL